MLIIVDALFTSVIVAANFFFLGDICALVIIGVHKKSSNFAVLGELRRYPLYITIINTILKYLNRIKELDHDSLLYQSFLESKFI